MGVGDGVVGAVPEQQVDRVFVVVGYGAGQGRSALIVDAVWIGAVAQEDLDGARVLPGDRAFEQRLFGRVKVVDVRGVGREGVFEIVVARGHQEFAEVFDGHAVSLGGERRLAGFRAGDLGARYAEPFSLWSETTCAINGSEMARSMTESSRVSRTVSEEAKTRRPWNSTLASVTESGWRTSMRSPLARTRVKGENSGLVRRSRIAGPSMAEGYAGHLNGGLGKR